MELVVCRLQMHRWRRHSFTGCLYEDVPEQVALIANDGWLATGSGAGSSRSQLACDEHWDVVMAELDIMTLKGLTSSPVAS